MDKHTKKHNQAVRAVAMLLMGMMAIPMATQLFLSSEAQVQTAELVALFNEDIEAIRQRAVEDRDRIRMQRRAYTRAVERCRDLLAEGKEVTCPDVNDFESYDLDITHEAASDEPTTQATRQAAHYSIRELSTDQRRILRSYTRAGFCSKTAGVLLYSLCMDIVGDTGTEAPVGLENENVYLHTKNVAGPSTLKLRLQMIDEAISGSKRASVRPTGY